MKAAARLFIFGGAAVVLGWVALGALNMLIKVPETQALAVARQQTNRGGHVAAILENKCAYCHVAEGRRPFYARWPVASAIIQEDMREGVRAFDAARELFPAGTARPSEASLARLEDEVEDNEMPPGRFLALHWAGGLTSEERAILLGWVRETRARLAAPGVPDALRGNRLRPLPAALKVDPARVALGRKLYNDGRLSGDGSVSCATCHDLAKGGTDQAPVSTGIRGQKGGINAPTTFNAALQFVQFWDGRAADLQEQAAGPPANPIEMGATWEGIVQTLNQDPALVAEFQAVYPDGITKANVTGAIAEFERTLLTPNSRFDRFLLGNKKALTAEEQKGYDLFVQTGCATCHVGELLGGTSFELMGTAEDYFARRGQPTDADNGRFNVTKADADRYRFKVPTLRNVARTAPYFHDGTQATLPQAVETMARVQLGVDLADVDRAAIVKFLDTLTGEYDGKPL